MSRNTKPKNPLETRQEAIKKAREWLREKHGPANLVPTEAELNWRHERLGLLVDFLTDAIPQ